MVMALQCGIVSLTNYSWRSSSLPFQAIPALLVCHSSVSFLFNSCCPYSNSDGRNTEILSSDMPTDLFGPPAWAISRHCCQQHVLDIKTKVIQCKSWRHAVLSSLCCCQVKIQIQFCGEGEEKNGSKARGGCSVCSDPSLEQAWLLTHCPWAQHTDDGY